MTKRADGKFKKRKHDKYLTPVEECVFNPLIRFLPFRFNYIDPCYGTGNIHKGLKDSRNPMLIWHGDINPKGNSFLCDATCYDWSSFSKLDYFITNPPWSRNRDGTGPLHEIIENLSLQAPTWLLFDADWAHTTQANPFLKYCHKIVAVGRVSWMGNGVKGFDNSAWYLFDQNIPCEGTLFYGRIQMLTAKP